MGGGEEFRPDFQKLDILRAWLPVPVMGLKGTATDKVFQDIKKHLCFGGDAIVVALLPDRPKIYIDVKECKKTERAEWLQIIFEHVSEKVDKSKKIIVFCRSIDTASDLWLYSIE